MLFVLVLVHVFGGQCGSYVKSMVPFLSHFHVHFFPPIPSFSPSVPPAAFGQCFLFLFFFMFLMASVVHMLAKSVVLFSLTMFLFFAFPSVSSCCSSYCFWSLCFQSLFLVMFSALHAREVDVFFFFTHTNFLPFSSFSFFLFLTFPTVYSFCSCSDTCSGLPLQHTRSLG